MVVEAPFKEQKIVIVSDNKARLSDNSLYDFIKCWYGKEFLAFSVSEDEYKKMKIAITEKKDFDFKSLERNLLLEGVSTDDLIKIGDYSTKRDKGCFYIQDKVMNYDENLDIPRRRAGDDSLEKVYTIETFEEVLDSYIASYIHNASVPLKEEVKVLEKVVIRKSDNRRNV